MKSILEVQGISKKFSINRRAEPYLNIRSSLRLFGGPREKHEEFWALRDVSFTLNPGDTLGIIGKNGAGKSTLLKILSRITPPTEGRIVGRGRVASLLEVGTGFHQELTGRENIFLNGSILGMKRSEIVRQFESIVDFSGTEKFIDTQLKYFSSGMQLRLAFSVAAFLEPEILIVDEVLAVGDAEFQKKCIGKMDEVSKDGRTILFVSHNMAAVAGLCKSAIMLESGEVVMRGKPGEVIHRYLQHAESESEPARRLSDKVSLTDIKLESTRVNPGTGLGLSFKISSTEINPISGMALLIYNELNERVGIVDLRDDALFRESQSGKNLEFNVRIHQLPLLEGAYSLGLFITSNFCQGDFYDLQRFHVDAAVTAILPYEKQYRGYVTFDHDMKIQGK